MLVIRLFRVGKKNQLFFKIVVIDKRKAAHRGRFVEEVGFYNPLTKEKVLKIGRIQYWLSVGAKPSNTMHNLFVSEKIIEGKKIGVHKRTKKKKREAGPEEPTPAPVEAAPGKEEKPTPVVEAPAAKPPEKKAKPKEESLIEEKKKSPKK